MAEKWSLSGMFYDICSCNVPCPCWWGISKPTKNGTCEFFQAFHIKTGQHGKTNFSGLSVIMAGHFSGVVLEGNWHVGLYIDDKASEAQRQVLVSIFSGEVGGVPGEVKGFIGEVKGVKYVPIHYHDHGNLFHWELGNVGEAGGKLVAGGREGQPVRAENTMLQPAMGLTEALTNLRTEKFKYDDPEWGWRWDNSGQNVWRAPFAWSGG